MACPDFICTGEIVFAFGQTWFVEIVPREYTTYVLLSKLKIFSSVTPMVNLHLLWMLLSLAKYKDLIQVLDRSARRTFLLC